MSLYFPSLRNPVMRPRIALGFRASRTSGPKPSFSRTPGRKGSIMMSMCGTKDLTNSTPEGDFKSTAIEDLCRVRRSEVGGGSLGEDAF